MNRVFFQLLLGQATTDEFEVKVEKYYPEAEPPNPVNWVGSAAQDLITTPYIGFVSRAQEQLGEDEQLAKSLIAMMRSHADLMERQDEEASGDS